MSDPVFTSYPILDLTASFHLICKTSYLGLEGPRVSYPGCEGKNCSAAPSLPPAQMHLGKGWTAHHHLTQETEEGWSMVRQHACACFVVCVYPLCHWSGLQPHGARGGRSQSAARRWKERTGLCRSPWNPSDQM